MAVGHGDAGVYQLARNEDGPRLLCSRLEGQGRESCVRGVRRDAHEIVVAAAVVDLADDEVTLRGYVLRMVEPC